MATLRLPAGQIAYDEYGAGAPVLLLHSLGTSKHLWDEVGPLLADSCHLFAPDYLGHGDSDRPPREYTISDHADTMAGFMRELGFDRYSVVGTSLGAIVGIDLGARYGRHLESLVLNGCAGWHLESQRMARLITVAERNVNPDGLPKVAQTAGSGALDQRQQDLVKSGRWFMSSMWAIASYDLAARLPKIACSTLVLMGDQDFHMATSYTLTDGIPHSRLCVIHGAGHLTPFDDPAGVAREVRCFLAEHADGSHDE